MKKFIFGIIAILIVFAIFLQTGLLIGMGIYPIGYKKKVQGNTDQFDYVTTNNIKYRVKAEGNFLKIYSNGKWSDVFLKGVNIGAGEPGLFPGDLTIRYEDYYKWFEQISAMNANCIRIYTTMRPQFYTALHDFNSKSEKPLYFFQGVWINEEDESVFGDVYANNSGRTGSA